MKSLSCRQEFAESVRRDATMSLVRRLVAIKRKIRRRCERGDISVGYSHARIIEAELKQRRGGSL